jgi:hypothetical protein
LSRTQLVELAGRHWLTSQLLAAGLEVARPERDHGIDLIAYLDLDDQVGDFAACPIQMKASTTSAFGLDPKYAKFRRLLMVYVWHLRDPGQTTAYALSYQEALSVATKMGWTKTASWLTGGRHQKPGYTTSKPSDRLKDLLAPFEMTTDKWRQKVIANSR